jgi:hypothetical protein
MKKEELRKVSYSLGNKPYEGYFHKWTTKKDLNNGSEYDMGLIEDKITGAIHEIDRGNILFHD